MHPPAPVRRILDWYDGERPGVKANLARLLMHGRTAGSGKLLILPALGGKRLVIFSGGPAKTLNEIYAEVGSIAAGDGQGSIIGRNSFQRPRAEALTMLGRIAEVYLTSAGEESFR